MTTMPPIIGAARLVLLLKSIPGAGAKIAHQAGYAFYGSPARWHKVTASKPAPKGAPVAAHPQAAGQHVPAAHMTDEQWTALQLPDSNVNAGPFNKALAKLKEWADSGNVTAIVGAGFGTNTYGKKLATIANHLLALYGSEHKVVAGQKAGEHGAVKSPAASEPAPLPDLDSPEDMATDFTKPAPAPAAAPVPAPAPAPAAKTDPVAGELQMPDFQEGKTTTGVKALYEKVGQKVIDHGHAGNVSVLEELAEPHKKMWQGKTPNSKKLLALHADALAYAKGETKQADEPIKPQLVSGIDDAIALEKQIKPGKAAAVEEINNALFSNYDDKFVLKDAEGKVTAAIAFGVNEAPGGNSIEVHHIGSVDKGSGSKLLGLAKDEAKKQGLPIKLYATKDAVGFYEKQGFTQVGAGATSDGGSLMQWQDGPKDGDTKPAADGSSLVFKKGRWHKFVAADESGELPPVLVPVSDAGVEKGDVFTLDSQYEKMNAGKWTVYNVSPDGQQVYMHKVGAKVPNQTNSANIPAATLAEAIAKGTAKKVPAEAPKPAAAPAAAAPAADAAPVPSSQAQSNLAMIPWDKQLLPDSNSNAGSHNKAVGKIKAMAEAGDKAGLQAFIDGKAGAKQTYTKKQALLAQTALAALGGDATAAVPLQQTPVPAPAPAPAASPEPQPADKYPLVNAWTQALSDGKHPTKEQAEAYEALLDSDPDAAMEYFMDAVNANVAPEDFADDKFDDALPAAHQKVHEMHGQALFGKVSEAPEPDPAGGLTQTQIDAIEKIAGLSDGSLEALVDSPGLPENVNAAIKKKLAEKQASAPKKTVTAVKTTYHNTQAGHSKSWSVYVAPTATAELGFDLVTEYGKIGGAQQKTAKSFPTEAAAHAAKLKLTNEKKAKGYVHADTDYGHKVELPSAVEQGPKEGDMKQGADGMLVLKDGHWVKMDDGAGGSWSFKQSDPGFSGAMTLYGPDGSIVAYMPGEGAEYHGPNDDQGEPSAQASDIAGLVKQMADLGLEPPPAAALQKLDPSYSAPAPKPAKPAKPAKTPAAVVKIEAVDPAAAMAWINAESGKADGAFVGTLPSKASQNWFVKWGNAYRGRVKKFGPDSWQTKIALGRALGAAFGHPGLALLTTGEWIPAKLNGVQIDQSQLVETDPVKVKAAAIALKQQMLGAAKGKAAAAPAQAAAAPTKAAAAPAAPAGAMPSVDSWVKTGGQGGSNPGGKFKDPSGQEWYVKWPNDADAVKSEVLAAKLYALAGLSSQDCMLVTKAGKTAIATKWVDIKKAGSATALSNVDGVHQGFAVDAWLGNWDVVGLSLDNLQIGPDGKAHRVDAGGSLEYRAQGEKKPFGAKVDEIDTLRDAAKNDKAAAVFGKMTQADITASVAKVAAISDIAIRAMVNQHGPGDADAKKKLADTLIARKADLLKRYPKAAKAKKKHEFKPDKISAPPSFTNWGGTGKGGPSSKEFLNQANEEAVQAIFAAAKTGDLAAVQGLKAKVYDKDTGKVIGEKPVLEHPSQHVKGYAQQAVNEINYQLNPPKRFRFDGGHPLHALNHAYPAHAGAKSSATAQKLGKFIVLGDPGTVTLQDAGMPAKITHSEGGGTLSQSTYKAAAQAAWNKMPATQRQAVQSYTGSSYHAMNGSLWEGNPSGAAKAAAEALQTLGHDIQPGTVLSRKISIYNDDLDQLLSAKGKVLQEPAIMSASIRPSSWSGNVHLKLHVGPGVKGLWVGQGSKPDGGGISENVGEDEMILPPNTRLLIISTKSSGGKDADGFGASSTHVIEAIILPTK
jgi:predicted DNA-binding WGR domain protein/N-acetylglutamate synthase-like GNAT family acetyltransferase